MSNVTLRKFTTDDFNDYFLLVSNEEVMKMITERAISLEEAEEKFRRIIERNNKYDIFGSYKVYSDANEFLGLGSLIVNEERQVEAELGYMLLPNFWGRGFGSVLADALIKIAKENNLVSLSAIIDPSNIPSRKILINRGFQSEKVCEIDGLPGEVLSMEL